MTRGVALITGASRARGMGAAIAHRLASDGWDLALGYFPELDVETYGESVRQEPIRLRDDLARLGHRVCLVEADLGDLGAPHELFERANEELGPVTALVSNHTHCVATSLLETTPAVLDRHLAVNVRSVLLLIQEFAAQFPKGESEGRIVTITSDHTAGNVPYGVSKGAADRLTDAAAYELGPRGITANAINPGPIDTGWMEDVHREGAAAQTPLPRAAVPADTANLISFLLSPEGGWITGQLLYSNGGFRGTIG
jgi:3-oxoacyl-[acyl-carrier protein] reductase